MATYGAGTYGSGTYGNMAGGAPVITVDSWRIYDDGTEAGAVAQRAARRSSVVALDTPIQVRFLFKNTGTAAAVITPRLQYRYIVKGAGGAVDWTPVRLAAAEVNWMANLGAATTRAKAAPASVLTDDGVTTQRLGVGTFVAGRIDKGDGIITTGVTVPAGEETEFVFSVQLPAADRVTNREAIQFRPVTSAGALYDAYTGSTAGLGEQFAGVNGPFTWAHGFEGGTIAAVLSTTLDDPDRIDTSAGSTPSWALYTATAYKGTRAAQWNKVAANPLARIRWWDTNQQAESYWRCYLYLNRVTVGPSQIIRADGGFEGGDVQAWQLGVNTARTLQFRNGAGSTLATSTTALALTTWYRLELGYVAQSNDGVADGSLELRIYVGDSTTPTETLGPYTTTTQTEWEDFEIGPREAGADIDFIIDAVALSNQGWLGPLGVAASDNRGITDSVSTVLQTNDANQVGFRGRNDDGTEATATWKAANNTPWAQAYDENFRLRFAVETIAGLGPAATYPSMEFRTNGSWQLVTASSAVRYVLSPNEAQGTFLTDQAVGGAGTYSADRFYESGWLFGATVAANRHYEFEACLQLNSVGLAFSGPTVEIRASRGPTSNSVGALATYTQSLVLLQPVTKVENRGLTDSVSTVLSNVNPDVTDERGLTDAATIEVALARSDERGLVDVRELVIGIDRSDSRGISDTEAEEVSIDRSDLRGLTDTRAVETGLDRSDLRGLTDTEAELVDLNRSDERGLTDSAVVSQPILDRSDERGLTDDFSTQLIVPGGLDHTDNRNLSDSFTIDVTKELSDNRGLTDTSTELVDLNRSDNRGLTDTSTEQVDLNRSDERGLTDEAVVFFGSLALADERGLTDTVVADLIPPIPLELADDRGLTDEVFADLILPPSYDDTDNRGLSDSITYVHDILILILPNDPGDTALSAQLGRTRQPQPLGGSSSGALRGTSRRSTGLLGTTEYDPD